MKRGLTLILVLTLITGLFAMPMVFATENNDENIRLIIDNSIERIVETTFSNGIIYRAIHNKQSNITIVRIIEKKKTMRK